MSAAGLNDRQWRALWALYAKSDRTLSLPELKAAIGKYARNTILSLSDWGLIAPGSSDPARMVVVLTDRGKQRIESVAPWVVTFVCNLPAFRR